MSATDHAGQTLGAHAVFERIRNVQNLSLSGSLQLAGTSDSSALHELLRQAESIIDIELRQECGGFEAAETQGGHESGEGHIGRQSGERVGTWLLLLAQGYLFIASSCKEKDDLIRMNAEKKVLTVFQRALAVCEPRVSAGSGASSLHPFLFDLACLIAKYHYEAAVGLVGCNAAGQAVQRRALYHCGEAVRHAEYALESSRCAEDSGSLESTIEIHTMLHHARVMQADCMVAAGMLVDASRVLGMLPDWSKARGHVVWYSEELLVRMRLYIDSDMADALDGSLRELGLLLSGDQNDFGPDDRTFLAKRLGRVLEGLMRRFGGRGGGGRVQCLDAVLFLIEAAPDVGVEALLWVVLEGLQADNDRLNISFQTYGWSKALCDLMLTGNVCGLVRTWRRELVDVVSVFQVAASRSFVVGDVDLSILFSRIVIQYGPESQRCWGAALLYALRVYKAYVLGDGQGDQSYESYEALDGTTRSHPFVMVVRMFHLKEQTHNRHSQDHRDVGEEANGDEAAGMIQEILSAVDKNPRAWTKEYVCAIHEIDDSILPMDLDGTDGDLELFLQTEHGVQAVEDLAAAARAAATDANRRFEELHAFQDHAVQGDLLKKIVSALQVGVVLAMEHESCEESEILRDAALRLAKISIMMIDAYGCGMKDCRGVLENVYCRLRMLSCNTQMDALLLTDAKGDAAYDSSLATIRHEIEELSASARESELPVVLLTFRYGLLTGDFGMIQPGDYDVVLQMVRDEEYFLELISVHLRACGKIPLRDYLEVLQYVVDNIAGGLEAILLSIALNGDTAGANVAYRIYSMVMRHLVNVPETLGETIMATNETAPALAAKVCMVEPRLAGFICDWDEDTEAEEDTKLEDNIQENEMPDDDGEDEIEEVTTRSEPAPYPSHQTQDEIESPPTATRKRKLSAAAHVISGLLDDLAPSEDTLDEVSRGESREVRLHRPHAAPWIDWIKRVFSP